MSNTNLSPMLDELLAQLASQLSAQKRVVATAESCTGGLVAKSLTDISGSSQWFDCGIVTYSNASKTQLLGVSESTLQSQGAVSQGVVKEMVLGLMNRSAADIGVSVSGIAGPGGGTADKPVGTVWIAWASGSILVEACRFQFSGDREQVRYQALYESLCGIKRILNSEYE